MTIKSTLPFFGISLLCFVIHIIVGLSFFAIDIANDIIYLICLTHIFLFCWLTIHMFIINKVHQKNKNQVIPVFLILSTLKMIVAVITIILFEKYLDINALQIVSHFFIAYFVSLVLQVIYSKKILR